ncbi:hypothetical protein CHLNCDRAFT_133663 [Chlorella variabilis]|uniref:2-isopropylmalate synthase n=1 Tax=Chlorella variabilis TaxID=554065 RepID=E1Z3J1_CHLVA|nr:hypothetical protein CHLNCDRAFT_133663 [Chlorella variabilis]EFN59861.1 hypothetical protein CHLNCDRAFT_133663 [Chlorella variabilis]|eukprot:XP_005851963.1 hypothetical protein CHLNCDRAFT_133663 [Chlorella variabilis]
MASCIVRQPLLAGCRATAGPRSSGRRMQPVRATAAPQQQRARPEYVPNRIDDPDYVRIFDTTLRDGEQSPGATLTSKEKLEIAKKLSQLGVDIIEAGFPIASPDDFEAVRAIAMDVGNAVHDDGYVPVICGLSRTREKDLETAWEAVRHAKLPRVHTFIATSEIHMKYKLRMSPDQVIENAVNAVKHLRSLGCSDIEFSPEDAGRSEPAFLYEILAEVIKAGATTLNIPDTTGWTLPHEFQSLISKIKANTPGAEGVIISTHCQNDLGLSTANSLAGAMGGARQIECTINGIGERAGNASLEEVVMAIALRGKDQMGGLWTGARPAIVGANAFAHESGIHQDGMLKNRDTYEIMSPETIGLQRVDAAGIVLGKHSGRNALNTRLGQLGFQLPEDQLNDVFRRFKNLADRKKNISDEDVLALVNDEVHQPTVVWVLEGLQVVCGSMGLPTATAIDSLVRVQAELVDYSVNSVTEGIEALANTRVVIRPAGKQADEGYVASYKGGRTQRSFSGSGADEDIVVSSARAYVSALNKMIGFISAKAAANGATSAAEASQDGAAEEAVAA